jgi:hypothetical protein
MSLWGRCAKIVAEMPDGQMKKYFLKASNYIINFTVSMCMNKSQLNPPVGCHWED